MKKFKLWLEQIDKSLRRKMERVVSIYLGKQPQVSQFNLVPDEEWDQQFPADQNALFGRPSGYATRSGEVNVVASDPMSALHEVLHQAGFNEDNVSEFWNEGITETVVQDIAQQFKLQIPQTYKQEVEYVRQHLIPLMQMSIQDFAKQYSKQNNKSKFLTNMIWTKYKDAFQNEDDWGTYVYESIEETFQRGLGPSFYIDYLSKEWLQKQNHNS